jgi:[acyl-carrier-protein] S-malonyltransferase
VLGRDLQQVCFNGPTEVLTQTNNAQPGILLVSLACLAALRERVPGLKFEAVAGLSLGEFSALAAAGVLSFEDALRVVEARGRYMQDACDATDGTMASVIGMEESPLVDVCREADVDLANLNCPGQIVISGARARVVKAVELAKARGAKRAILLQVAGAYHSRLMTEAQSQLAVFLEGVEWKAPTVTLVHNVTARPAASLAEAKELMVRQVTSSVRWSDSMRWLIAEGYTRFIELGPGNVLSGLMRRIDGTVSVLSVSDAASLEAAAVKLSAPASGHCNT